MTASQGLFRGGDLSVQGRVVDGIVYYDICDGSVEGQYDRIKFKTTRYSELDEFHASIIKEVPDFKGQLPRKRRFSSSFYGTSDAHIESRRFDIQVYLRVAATDEKVSHSKAFRNFFQLPNDDLKCATASEASTSAGTSMDSVFAAASEASTCVGTSLDSVTDKEVLRLPGIVRRSPFSDSASEISDDVVEGARAQQFNMSTPPGSPHPDPPQGLQEEDVAGTLDPSNCEQPRANVNISQTMVSVLGDSSWKVSDTASSSITTHPVAKPSAEKPSSQLAKLEEAMMSSLKSTEKTLQKLASCCCAADEVARLKEELAMLRKRKADTSEATTQTDKAELSYQQQHADN